MNNFDCIIIGRGPAGLSAALYCARAGLQTMIIGKDDGALAKALHIENYFGADGNPSGPELLRRARSQASLLKVKLISDEVININPADGFTVECSGGSFGTKAVILATGANRKSTTVKNASLFEGKGLSYCAVCDAFFYRGKTIAVLGAGDYALHELSALTPVASKCYLLTDGANPPKVPDNVQCVQTTISSVSGGDFLQSVIFKDGSTINIDGLFVALGVAGAGALARKLGAEVNGDAIVTDKNGRCTLPGLFAAGDCTGGILQASVAVGEGAAAALSAIGYIKSKAK